ncbi:MAG: aminomethyltransferase family protein [Acidobacteria bacterium]|nr:aminomethyltransferase family protein [Acidobacteriota bacterium]MCW5967456.1 aminomethyltransferase family protein [Blastocatellales bacterium]
MSRSNTDLRDVTSDFALEYAALHSGAGLIDLSGAGVLEVSGSNAVQFLNGLVSNDVKMLSPGEGTIAAFLNVQGKVLALSRIYRTENKFLLELEACNRLKILHNLSRFVPAGGFFVSDLSEKTAIFSVQGPRSDELAAALTGSVPGAAPYSHREALIDGIKVRIANHARCGPKGFDMFAPADLSDKLLTAILEPAACRLVGRAAFDTARIEAGVALEPHDIDESHILLETGRNDAVSYTKGCYLGQEIIARIHWRGRPAKQITGLLLRIDEASETIDFQSALLFAEDGKKVGDIKSITYSPRLGRSIALGYVHRNYLEPGTSLIVRIDDREMGRAEVTSLPFTVEN